MTPRVLRSVLTHYPLSDRTFGLVHTFGVRSPLRTVPKSWLRKVKLNKTITTFYLGTQREEKCHSLKQTQAVTRHSLRTKTPTSLLRQQIASPQQRSGVE